MSPHRGGEEISPTRLLGCTSNNRRLVGYLSLVWYATKHEQHALHPTRYPIWTSDHRRLDRVFYDHEIRRPGPCYRIADLQFLYHAGRFISGLQKISRDGYQPSVQLHEGHYIWSFHCERRDPVVCCFRVYLRVLS